MYPLDSWILSAFNSLVGQSATFDALLVLVSSNFLFKGAWVVAVYPLALYRAGENETKRAILIHGLVAALASIPVARLIGSFFPFRLRPIHDSLLHVRIAQGLDPSTLFSWTSFPSDHATVFATIATTLALLSWRAGALAFAYVLLVIDLPRLCLGLHYPSDIVAGTLVGVAVAAAGLVPAVRQATAGWGLRLWKRNRGGFWVVFALLVYSIGIAFEPIPQLLRFLRDIGAETWHGLLALF
jgi:undecaprenyl-diphosphatase